MDKDDHNIEQAAVRSQQVSQAPSCPPDAIASDKKDEIKGDQNDSPDTGSAAQLDPSPDSLVDAPDDYDEDDQDEDEQEGASNNKDIKTRFAFMRANPKSVFKKPTSPMLSGGIALIIGAVIIGGVLTMKHALSHKPVTVAENSQPNADIGELSANANKIAIEEREAPVKTAPSKTATDRTSTDQTSTLPPPMSHPTDNADQKQWKMRQNAPTKIYEAKATSNSAGDSSLGKTSQFGAYSNMQVAQPQMVSATKFADPQLTIAEGEFIHATLETAIDSDMPGMLRAVVSRNVYAYEGERVLIPKGSRLIGQYSSLMTNGQASARVFVIWNRIITPKGVSIQLNSPGADALGRAGMGADTIDHHFLQIFGASALISILSAAVSNAGVSDSDQYNSSAAYRQQVSSSMAATSSTLLSKSLAIKPTIHLYQGNAIVVFVAKDLDFKAALAKAQTNDHPLG